MSDLCFAEDACQASDVMGDGAREVERVCRMVKLGCRVAINIDPLEYLYE